MGLLVRTRPQRGCHVPHRQVASGELSSLRRKLGTLSAEPLNSLTFASARTYHPLSSPLLVTTFRSRLHLCSTPISTKGNQSTFFATREAHEYWKTSGRFCNHGIVCLGWSRTASRRMGLWPRLSKRTTILFCSISTTPLVSTNLRNRCLGAAVSNPCSCLASQR